MILLFFGVRRDKYQPSIREYWVDVSTTGSLKSQVEESLTEQTAIEGEVENLTVGLPSEGMELAPLGDQSHEVAEETDQELEDVETSSARTSRPAKEDVSREWALDVRAPDSVYHTPAPAGGGEGCGGHRQRAQDTDAA